jgi:hypothetical protein
MEAKLLNGTAEQYQALDEAIRTAQFVRNKCVRYWMDNKGVKQSCSLCPLQRPGQRVCLCQEVKLSGKAGKCRTGLGFHLPFLYQLQKQGGQERVSQI